MVCTVLNFSFMAFTTHNCSLNISLPVSGWGSVLMNTEIHLPGVMYDPILMFYLDENAWERQGTDFYICNNTGLKMWAMIFVQRLMAIYHLIYRFLFINLYLDVFQGIFIGNKLFFLTLKHFWHPVLLKYGYFRGEGSLNSLPCCFPAPREAGNLYSSSLAQ